MSDIDDILSLKGISLRENGVFRDMTYPRNYQKRAALVMLRRPNMILGDDTGLGKSVETILALSYLLAKDQDLKVLVLAEKSALFQWKKEFDNLTKGLDVEIITAITYPNTVVRKEKYKSLGRVTITTLHSLYKSLDDIKEGLGFKYILVMDETNYFQNSKTKIFDKLKELSKDATRRYGLTATLVERNNLDAVYSIMRIVAPDCIPSRRFFEMRFVKYKTKVLRLYSGGKRQERRIREVEGYKNLDEFRELISSRFYGRLASDPEVEGELPEDIHVDVDLVMSKEQSRKVVEVESGLFLNAEGSLVKTCTLATLVEVQLATNSPALRGFDIPSVKEEAVVEALIGSLFGKKVIVYSTFRTQIDRLQGLLEAEGLVCLRITGSEDAQQREDNKNKFNESPDHNIILITKAGNRSINLQAASCLIMYDLPYNYGRFRQLVGRMKRMSSCHKHVLVWRLLTRIHPEVVKEVSRKSDLTVDHAALDVLMNIRTLVQTVQGDDLNMITSEKTTKLIYERLMNERPQQEV